MLGHTDAMRSATDEDLEWIGGTPVARTIRSAIPAEYDVCGLLDLADDNGATEKRLLSALRPAAGEPLIAGGIERNSLLTETGDVHLLHANWRYRCRSSAGAETCVTSCFGFSSNWVRLSRQFAR